MKILTYTGLMVLWQRIKDLYKKISVSAEQTTTSTADGGTNVMTFTFGDGTSTTFSVKNGSKGSDGARGATGATGAKGEKGDRGPVGETGPQGNSGITDASNKALINDAITGGETSYLSAEVGKLGILTYDCSKGGTIEHASLQDAINAVPTTFRKAGITIIYKSGDSIYRYTLKSNTCSSDTANWFSVEDKLSDISEKTRNITKNKTIDTDEKIIITDESEDEIILEITDSGVDVKNLKSNGIDILDELDKKVTKDLLNSRTDGINHEQSQRAESEVIFGKSEENPSLVIGEESVKVKSITDLQGNPIGGRLPLLGKELFTIGDSLSTSGIWQQKVSALTGCTFDVEKNTKNGSELSQGGTTTNEASLHSGIIRAFNLKVNNYSPDIILLQNVNDQTCFDDKGNNKYESGTAYGKKAFVPTQIIEGGAYSQWKNNASSYLGTINVSNRKFGSIIKFADVQNGKKVSVSKLPTSSGNIRITINGVSADISVSSADTKASIIHKIFEYNYGNDIQKNENLNDTNPYVEFYTSSALLTLAYTDSDSTSMTIVSEDKQTNTVVLKYFLGESLQDWQNVDSWKNGLTPYQAWKGMIEFCILNYPTAKIALLMFPRFKFDRNLYINKDGTFNQDLYNEKDVKDGDSEAIKEEKIDRIKCRARISLQEDVAQFYNLPIIDLNKDCGINVGNYLSFYPNNNVHPKDFGYEFYGSIIANKIISI